MYTKKTVLLLKVLIALTIIFGGLLGNFMGNYIAYSVNAPEALMKAIEYPSLYGDDLVRNEGAYWLVAGSVWTITAIIATWLHVKKIHLGMVYRIMHAAEKYENYEEEK